MAKKKKRKQDNSLAELYAELTELEVPLAELGTKELERLSAKAYNALQPKLTPRQQVVFNELFSIEVELDRRISRN